MKLIIAHAPYLLLPNVVARRPSRQHRKAFANSNDMMNFNDLLMNWNDLENSNDLVNSNDLISSIGLIDMLTFNEMLVRDSDCEGIYVDWAVPSAAATGGSSTIVQYDYDMFIEKGSDLNTALASLQNRILRHVGRDVFSGCSRRLTVGAINLETERQLDGTAIDEISSAPSDTVSISSSCKIEDATTETECYPISGYITAYYISSRDESSSIDEDVRRLDEFDDSNIQDTITNSVKSAMDDIEQVYYLGDRDTFSFDTVESYLGEQPSIAERDVETNSPSNPWWPILVGASVGLVAMAGVAVLYKKRKSNKDDDEPVVVESADEDLEQQGGPQEEQQEDHIETAELEPNEESKTTEGCEYSEANCTSSSVE